MSDQILRLTSAAPAWPEQQQHMPLGRYLVRSGIITQDQLVHALQMQLQLNAPIGEILVAEGWAKPEEILTALALQNGVQLADFEKQPPEPDLCDLKPSNFWLSHNAIPWMRLGPMVLIATSRPDKFDTIRAELTENGVLVIPALASEEQIDAALARQFAPTLAKAAETRVEPIYSCRNRRIITRMSAVLGALAIIAITALAPGWSLALMFLLAIGTLSLFATLKFVAFVTHLLNQSHLTAPRPSDPPPPIGFKYPKVSVLVPLYKEREIASALIRRLSRLTYPKALLDVILVLEEEDDVTRQTVAETDLPGWIRVIQVPAHEGLTTKPRAMNYALDFCRGDIIGVWDAEDAPMADQIEHVVSRFARAPDDVVCLQGILDYYNPRSSWRARCFTIEYSSWFRIILPGIARLGLVVPLGGTTLFFKRKELEELGGWDAHNVTEDADLGVRLCRAGYRTELIDTVTYEEANFRAWPWVKQRSRWLKGFMVTYLVHMRSPKQLWRDLGPARFLGVQAFFLGTLGQFLLAPILWSFWLVLLGWSHPVDTVLPATVIDACIVLFVITECLALTVGMASVSRRGRRFLMPWTLMMPLYFPLGVLAAYKALYELAVAPFFWDKTQHGQVDEALATTQA
ncbi:glycosyltransferase [Tropicibacter sp. R16_0]|uniref:glycosyltransferase n=1 Tax=Tropicibacter sp. R16_0 TaxID=2821102 RepID=UPI001AD9E5C6|nr:glycosyltransferase [Tropicibacter sp. R16_0]MBO9450116.1 glycosyltransferase [Tropicibacter sp. R16_0]